MNISESADLHRCDSLARSCHGRPCHFWKSRQRRRQQQLQQLIRFYSASQWESINFWHRTLLWEHKASFCVCLFDSILTTAPEARCFFSFLLFQVGLSATLFFKCVLHSALSHLLSVWNVSARRQAVISIVIADPLPVIFNYCAASLHWQVISPFRFGSLLMMLLKWLHT